MASKASPSRNMCSPSANGPTCSTSTCSSRSRDLSKPCSRQAEENAQVLQNWYSSPSSAAAGEGRRVFTVATAFRQAWSDHARMTRTLRQGRWLQVTVETHRDHTQQQAATRGGGDAFAVHVHEPVMRERCKLAQRVGEAGLEEQVVALLDA